MATFSSALNLNLSKSHLSTISSSQIQHRSSLRHEVSIAAPSKRVFTPNVANLRPKATGADIATAATSSLITSESIIRQMIDSNRVLKSHISKMAVVELRNECTLAGLSTDGLKVDLVDRLLAWATEKARAQHSTSSRNNNNVISSGSDNEDAFGNASSTKRAGRPSKSLAENSSKILATSNGIITSSSSSSTNKGESSFQTNHSEIKVQWLGTSSGAPTSRRNVSCIAVRHQEKIFLVDCGEGTRNQLRAANLNPALVSHIFITHLHGDHCFGIPGTLAAIAAARVGTPLASEPIQVYGPPDLHRLMLASFKTAGLQLTTPVIVKTWVFDPAKEVAPSAMDPAGRLLFGTQPPDQAGVLPAEKARIWQSIYDSGTDQVVRPGLTWSTKLPNGWTVTAAQLQHRMPCWGYVFEEPATEVDASEVPPRRRQDTDRMSSDGEERSGSESDGDYTAAAGTDANETTRWIRPGRKMVLLGDTCDSSAMLDIGRACDLLSHEATFQKGMEEKAAIATHSTSEQAGNFAKQLRAKNLVLTHFSGRYEQSDKYQKVWVEAKQKGKSMKEMHVSNVVPLAEEARAAAGGAKVFLANDFYAFRVSLPLPIPEKLFLDVKKRQQENLMKRLEYHQRQASGNSGGGGGNAERDYERYNGGDNSRRENYNNTGGSGGNGGGQRQYQQRSSQYQEWRRPQQQQRNYAGGQRRTGGGGGY